MNNNKSARLGLAAAVWLVLSVAVFGTLIGIAWMSMNATTESSTDAIVVDAVEEASNELDSIIQGRDMDCYHFPASQEGDSTTLNPPFQGYVGEYYHYLD